MPVFHTKLIESILDPVAQQISQLVILHEQAEDGAAMPDLTQPVSAVAKAVGNLVQVGRQTSATSTDKVLQEEMPVALDRVENASISLIQAAKTLRQEPLSRSARDILINGARGILGGTSALLLSLDQAEVRKIIRICKGVQEYLAVAEVVEGMEDLIVYVKNLTPGMTQMVKMVDGRQAELTHQVHRNMLIASKDKIKNLLPVLISSIKIFVTTIQSPGKRGLDEAASNRLYVVSQMYLEIEEIIRVLQLTTYDEDDWNVDDLTVMKKAAGNITARLKGAKDWLSNPNSAPGGIGEQAIRMILEDARKVAARCDDPESSQILKLVDDINVMTNELADLRARGQGNSPQALQLSRVITEKLNRLEDLVDHTVKKAERSGVRRPAYTVAGKVEQAQKWLAQPGVDDGGVGLKAIKGVIDEGRRLANHCSGQDQEELLRLSDETEILSNELANLCGRGMGNSPQAQALSRRLADKLEQLKYKMEEILVKQVAEDFMDTVTPLKQLTEAALAPADYPNREQNYTTKAEFFLERSNKLADTARMIGQAGGSNDKRLVEEINAAANQVDALTPQVISAGRLVLYHPNSTAAVEHFDLLKKEWTNNTNNLTRLVDDATDSVEFIKACEDVIRKETVEAEFAASQEQPVPFIKSTSKIARCAQRVVMVAQQEADNSEDPTFVEAVSKAAEELETSIPVSVGYARGVATKPNSKQAQDDWMNANQKLYRSVLKIRGPLAGGLHEDNNPPLPPPPVIQDDELDESLIQLEQAMRDLDQPDTNYGTDQPKVQEGIEDVSMSVDGYTRAKNAPILTLPPPPPPPQVAFAAPPRPPPPSSIMGHPHQAEIVDGVVNVRDAVLVSQQPPVEEFAQMNIKDTQSAPPRPPSPGPPPRPPPPEEPEEEEVHFPKPRPDQPIMTAAYDLHQETSKWSSKGNDLIAAAKKMALLMAEMSKHVRGEGGSKKELIDCAKAIAKASEEVTRLAKEITNRCPDKRMKTNLFQVCERIPTMATQLKILSTVKATMLGSQDTEEDQEATEMLVGNAQNLMQSVKETVRAAEAASIKIRTDAGQKLRWVRRNPWYQ
ncbi:vinculin-like isoform X1 [Anneissia japonica]|uniref:vinculin-like isoform X1 n=1 Tax=Anneissia japonica TaxID=1529436 RepID=UPI001425796D|nr:vinculin-like isoform X1 [Anneissia japonica]